MASAFKESQGKCAMHRSGKVRVTILASEWGSSKGGLSTINRTLSIQLAKSSDVEISFFVPQCSEKDKTEALKHNIRIVEATQLVGYEELDLLSFPPDDLEIEVVIGHGVKLGRQAQVIKRSHRCKWVQVVHTDPEEIGMFKCYSDSISRGEEKHNDEVKLCEKADFVVGIGPKLTEAFRSYLRFCKYDRVFDFTPGIFEEFLSVEQVHEEGNHRSVLVFGRGDVKDFKLKGFDIAGKAIASLVDTRLVFVGAPNGKQDEIKESFMQCGLSANHLRVRGYDKSRESLKQLFCEVDLVIVPSRTDGFGLTGLEALSAGLPVLVSKNTGFGEALCKVLLCSPFVIDSDNPDVWAAAIKSIIWDKDRHFRLDEAKTMRTLYDKKYSWPKQCDVLRSKIIELADVDGNSNLRRPPIDVCKRGLSSIRGYFESLEAVDTQAVHSQRLKVMLLGEAGAGKSSLAYALVNTTALTFPDGQAHSTVGVDFYTWRPVRNGIEFHIADFAGQRRYQLTHPFFLSSEALHILVVDLFNYDSTESCFCRTIGDWLDLVTFRVLKPRVMIVPTHLDEFGTSDDCLVKSRCDDIINRVMHYCKGQSALIDLEILEKKKKGLKNAVQGGSDPEWKKNNPPIISSGLSKGADQLKDNESYIAMVPVSSIGELTGIKELQDEIIRVANDSQLFPSVGRDLPEDWITLEKALKDLRVKNQVRCMSFNEFESFSKQHTSLSPLGRRSALSYLDSIGELRYYKSIPSDYDVFIDLKWLAKLVKCLFRHDLEATLKFDEVYFKYNVIGGNFENLKTKLLKEALLAESLLRCLWHEMNLDDDMFPQMVELLHHLGLACPMPPDGSDEQSLLVPWFLREYPEAVDPMPDTLPEDQDEIHLLFMMAYLPPGLFNRLRVRCCSPHCDHYNWKDHVILLMNEHRVLIWKDKHPPGTESNSPAIHIRGRTPKGCREILWEVLLHLVQETEALLAEWQRLNVQRFSLCPPCMQKGKPSPCLFPCNWMSTNSASKGLSTQTKICKGGSMFLRVEKFDINLIYPPPDVVKRVLDAPSRCEPDVVKRVLDALSRCEPVSEDVPQALIADVSQQITKQWTVVASYLGIQNDQVDALDADNTSVADKIIAMLNAWNRQKTNKATRSNLVKALEKANRNDVAEKVRLFKEQ